MGSHGLCRASDCIALQCMESLPIYCLPCFTILCSFIQFASVQRLRDSLSLSLCLHEETSRAVSWPRLLITSISSLTNILSLSHDHLAKPEVSRFPKILFSWKLRKLDHATHYWHATTAQFDSSAPTQFQHLISQGNTKG